MRKVIVHLSLSLDGVIQAPGRADEDVRGGFTHGGWAAPYFDHVMGQAAAEGMVQAPALLFGRRTYEDFYAVWPKRGDNPFTEVLNRADKYVATRTPGRSLPWANSTPLTGDAGTSVAELKGTPGKDLVVLGSGELVQALMRANLVDEYALLIHPLVLGSGRRLFPADGPRVGLRLVDSRVSTTGVVIARYRPVA